MLSAIMGWMVATLIVLIIAAIACLFCDPHQRDRRLWWLFGLMAPVIMLILILVNIVTAPCQ